MADAETEREQGATWPEQGAVEAWWSDHRHDLKERVSEYRIQVQRERDRLVKAVEEIANVSVSTIREDPPRLDEIYKIARDALEAVRGEGSSE